MVRKAQVEAEEKESSGDSSGKGKPEKTLIRDDVGDTWAYGKGWPWTP
jgi:hypothetical protein